MSLYLELKAAASNESTESLIAKAVEIANRLGITVEADIRGVTLIVEPGDDPATLFANWERAFSGISRHKIASNDSATR